MYGLDPAHLSNYLHLLINHVKQNRNKHCKGPSTRLSIDKTPFTNLFKLFLIHIKYCKSPVNLRN